MKNEKAYNWGNTETKETTDQETSPVTESKVEVKTERAALDKKQQKIADRFIKEGFLLDEEAISVIAKQGVSPKKIMDAAKERGLFFITNEFVEEFFPKKEKKTGQEFSFTVHRGGDCKAAKIESQLKIEKNRDITGKSTSEGNIENFVDLFRDRYSKLKDVLAQRMILRDSSEIEEVRRYDNEEVKIIGMVRNIRKSKKGNLVLELEDPTGSILVIGTRELKNKDATLVDDEVVGVVGTVKGEIIIASEIIEPDIPMTKTPKRVDEEVSVAFLSDIHAGSLLFMEKQFKKFVEWLNLRTTNQKDVAETIKYIVVAGDLVDGVGIYPGQEKELAIPDIYKQYNYLAKLLEPIPDYIEVVLSVGNHDAVRRSEPQPAIKELSEELEALPNVHCVGNPCWLQAHGVDILEYHGTSMDALISSVSKLSYNNPERAQVEYLRKRHLSPIYGKREQIAPEEKDYMVIDKVPDIFHCGHVHRNGYAMHRGVRIINSGTWQSRTEFQEQQGHIPTPCKVPILELSGMQLKVVNFA